MVGKKTLLLNVALAIFAVVIVIYITMVSLDRYTDQGATYVTPDFVGRVLVDCEADAKPLDLKLIATDTIFRYKAKPGEVLLQYPEAGHEVKKGRRVFLTIASDKAEMVEVPNMVDLSIRQAKVLIARAGLNLDSIKYVPSPYDGLVLEQNVTGMVKKRSFVTLSVGSSKKSRSFRVIDLDGYSLSQVKQYVEKNDLYSGYVGYGDNIITREDSVNAVVVKQSPERGTSITSGDVVNIWLDLKKEENDGADR